MDLSTKAAPARIAPPGPRINPIYSYASAASMLGRGEEGGPLPADVIPPMNENELAHDDVRTEYHLTRESWVTGTHRYFGKISGKVVERPRNAVETWECHIQQPTMYEPERRSTKMLWHDESVPQGERAALRARFTRPF